LSFAKRLARSALDVVKNTTAAAPGFTPSFLISGVAE